ncbi:DUF4382 domain-containing protein [Variovorax sp.]|uniref:DUF4382 domain-containing protein n=1 Tax=Variovorax sp. TaxID=1871043 RepID=UPI002D5B7A2C|nr:DUF4382 domain-containing protein [Variovorax sp.]HYP85510.1 DUF4382 domain-containing protein [Variovorax sp.]
MKTPRWLGACALVAMLAACGGGGGGGAGGGSGGDGGIGGTGATSGKMRVSLTDAPACGYDAVNVTIEKIRVHASSGAEPDASGWFDLPLAQPQRVDLLKLTNGVLFPLAETQLPAGHYQQMRLVLAANNATSPLANSVVPSGSTEVPLDTPSAQQSGLKLNMDVDVPADKVVDVVIDFDACKSVVKRGNSGRYNLKPVISVIPVINDGGMRVEGWLDPALAGPATLVALQQQGVTVKATYPTADGRFALFPVPAGTYDLVVTAPGRATTVVTGVPVTDATVTALGSSTLPLVSPVSTMREVEGTVVPDTATVRALQTLGGGPVIEVAAPPVAADTGDFLMALPIAAPLRAPYLAGATSYAFAPDAGAAGRYTVTASGNGTSASTVIDVTAPVAPLAFDLR